MIRSWWRLCSGGIGEGTPKKRRTKAKETLRRRGGPRPGGRSQPPTVADRRGDRLRHFAAARRWCRRFAAGCMLPSFCPSERSLFMNRPNRQENRPVMCRGVRGAITVDANDRHAILTATRQLLALMIRRNQIVAADVASATFTLTRDLDAEFPALAARQLGWLDVPLLCG